MFKFLHDSVDDFVSGLLMGAFSLYSLFFGIRYSFDFGADYGFSSWFTPEIFHLVTSLSVIFSMVLLGVIYIFLFIVSGFFYKRSIELDSEEEIL